MSPLLLKQRFWFWVLTVATVTALILVSRLPKNWERPAELPVYGKIPDFQLTEAGGRRVSPKDLEGKIWIADFIFTRCAGICPMMSGRMKRLQEKFKDVPDVMLVSFSVDPEYDTPERLLEYAKRFDADSKKWIFLTGDKAQIRQLSQQHFHLGVADIPEAEREAPDQSVDHSSKFALVDPQGQIRGYYASDELDFLDKLVPDVNALIGDKS